jgi:GTP-binding protein
VATVGDFSFVIADIPGLIEGASQGAGLGLEFLRHVERTRLLVHVLDGAGVDGRDPGEDYRSTNHELAAYSSVLAERHQVVAVNKIDLPDGRERAAQLQEELAVPADDFFTISAATQAGVQALLNRVAALLQELPQPTEAAPTEEILVFAPPPADEHAFTITQEEEGWRVRGIHIERAAEMTNFDNYEGALRFQRILRATGVEQALREAGVGEDDVVRIASKELYWQELGEHEAELAAEAEVEDVADWDEE